jgi:hypothetical protein
MRAALREAGYDAIGTRSLDGALAYAAETPGRGPVRAIVVDGSAIDNASAGVSGELLTELRRRHGAVPVFAMIRPDRGNA